MTGKIKKTMAGILTAALVIAPVMSVNATGTTYTGTVGAGTTGGNTVVDDIISENEEAGKQQKNTPEPKATAQSGSQSTTEGNGSGQNAVTASTPAGEKTGVSETVSDAETAATPEADLNQTGENESEAVHQPTEKPESRDESSGTAAAQVPSEDSVQGIQSGINGVYLGTAVNGCAVITSEDEIRKAYGISKDEKPYAQFLNLNTEKNPESKKALELAASAQGAEVGPMLSIELGKITVGGDEGKYSLLPSDGADIEIVFGIPDNFAADTMSYGVACVREDGTVTVWKDIDDDRRTATFKTTGGIGNYALIRSLGTVEDDQIVLTDDDVDLAALAKEIENSAVEGEMVVEEVERNRGEAGRSKAWIIAMGLIGAGILATGLLVAGTSRKARRRRSRKRARRNRDYDIDG
ncbi:MAG: hypothetical protein J6C64_14760 [Lachnospiraceae bacterium]|nr:hypothetical protein [Lachnospiraceae bacterium]